MEIAVASAIGVLVAAGLWLMLRARTFELVLGLTLLSYAVNLLIFSMGRLAVGKPPVLDAKAGAGAWTLANHVDPLPQALVLTAIVIGFATTAVLLVVAIRNRADNRSDHVDAGAGEDAARGPRP